MPTDAVRFTGVTPNLIVRDIAASTRFYCDVLGFTVKQTVPDTAPFVFVWLERGDVTVFLNDPAAVAKDIPAYGAPRFGGTATLFVAVEGVDALHAAVAPRAPVVMSLRTQFYGMREFAIHDPDGHLITFAERVEA
jgi:catechol 2,3-dioxygenase-like lactoylglutathione lyase family enzyme